MPVLENRSQGRGWGVCQTARQRIERVGLDEASRGPLCTDGDGGSDKPKWKESMGVGRLVYVKCDAGGGSSFKASVDFKDL